MKWGKKYDAKFVNTLRSMVARHLSIPHRFVCFTDDAQGIDERVEVFPLPEMDLPEGIPERCWRKLATFAPTLGDLQGTTLFLDLDIVILQSIDSLFEAPGEFLIIHDWKRPWRIEGNSSVYRFEIGRHPEVLDYFVNNLELVRKNHRHEQSYLSKKLYDKGVLSYWPSEWCCSFKRRCLPKWPLSWVKQPYFPEEAKIVVFHGDPNPDTAIAGKRAKRFRYMQPTPWVAEHWR